MLLVIVLAGVLLLVMAALLWQEVSSGRRDEGAVYVINDAVEFVSEHLDSVHRLRRSDILRIIEYQIFLLQGLAQEDRSNPVDTVAGSHAPSVTYIVDRIAEKHGATYDVEAVRAVLELEAMYLERIGAIGAEVTEDSQEDDRR